MLLRAAELAAADEPFALATVVSVVRPTSAKPGAHGIVHPDRSVEGWVGGSCARPTVIREALRSLADGEPRLIRLAPTVTDEGRLTDGVVEYAMTCHSGGTLEIFVEPHLPAPALWIGGSTPIASALADLGAAAGFRVTLVDPGIAAEVFPSAHRVVDAASFEELDSPAAPPFVLVATQGQWDEDGVDSALRRETAYVGLVASPRRSESVRAYLRERDLPPDVLARLRAPAGLDLGARTPEEVAISILAELVQVRRSAQSQAADSPTAPARRREHVGIAIEPAHTPDAPDASDASRAPEPVGGPKPERPPETPSVVLRDPVCGMRVDPEDVRYTAEHDGTTYAFCCRACQTRFSKDPLAYLAPASPN